MIAWECFFVPTLTLTADRPMQAQGSEEKRNQGRQNGLLEDQRKRTFSNP